METAIKKWGNSFGIRIPLTYAKDLNLTSGCVVEMTKEHDKIIIAPKRERLDELLSMVTDENMHEPIETGASLGSEQW